jgi:hypothetical protein
MISHGNKNGKTSEPRMLFLPRITLENEVEQRILKFIITVHREQKQDVVCVVLLCRMQLPFLFIAYYSICIFSQKVTGTPIIAESSFDH